MQHKEKNGAEAVKGFSRFAHVYDQYNMIQAEAVKTLVNAVNGTSFRTIADIGSGSGAVLKKLQEKAVCFEKFIAVDLSEEMLSLHPEGENIVKIRMDFNDIGRLRELCKEEEVLILSSSALQWSKDPDLVFSELSKCGKSAYFAIFTSATFKTLHQTAGITSPIYTEEELKCTIEKYYDATFWTQAYQLSFPDTKEMFRYIQKSGVSGGERRLGYQEMKRVMREYPLDYLEFEVLFVEAMSRQYV